MGSERVAGWSDFADDIAFLSYIKKLETREIKHTWQEVTTIASKT